MAWSQAPAAGEETERRRATPKRNLPHGRNKDRRGEVGSGETACDEVGVKGLNMGGELGEGMEDGLVERVPSQRHVGKGTG